MANGNAVFNGFPVVGSKPVRLAFDGGVLLLAEVKRRLGIAERQACCIDDPRDPAAVRHSFAEMIRLRASAPAGRTCKSWSAATATTAASKPSPSANAIVSATSSGLPATA